MVHLLDRRLLFVTGKGGVGKSTISASLALFASRQGKRTLLVEVDAKGNLSDFFETKPTGWKPREVQPGLFVMTMDTEESLQEYLRLQLRLPAVARIGPLAKAFEFVATAAPGVKEILTIGKPVWEVRERHFDLVVVDSVATGHIVGQLSAPQAINELVQVGLIRSQTGWMLEILNDPTATGLVIVATPEEMPVNETIELTHRIDEETQVDVAAVVVNRVLPELFGRGEEACFEQLSEPALVGALSEAVGASPEANGEQPSAVDTVFDAARLAVTLRRTRASHLDRLRAGLEPSIPMLYVPELFTRSYGLRAISQVADALAGELE
jgi:anion-transporting  ArsA/GET3 family ATPase